MAEGFQGFGVSLTEVEETEFAKGFKGFTIEIDARQYIEPAFGFKGFTIEMDYTGETTKTVKKRIIIP